MGTEWGSNLPKARQQIHGTAWGLACRVGPQHAVLSFTTPLLQIPGSLGFMFHQKLALL